MVNLNKVYRFLRFQRGPTFSRGVQLFPGGSNCLFPIETHITCDFPGGGPDPLPPSPPSGSALGSAQYAIFLCEPKLGVSSFKYSIFCSF